MEIIGEIGSLIQSIASADGRYIALPGTFNVRDVGGYPAGDRGLIRWRTLLRSDALHRVAADGMSVLAGLELRTVIDLRTHVEAEIARCSLDGIGAQVLHISVLGGDLTSLPTELGAIYRHVVEDCGDAIGAVVRRLCAPGALPALIHCSAGKDRTGIVVALILAAVGVPDDVIAADYALSGTYLDPANTTAIGQVRTSSGLGDQLTAALLGSPPELIAEVLGLVRRQAGSVSGYLMRHGLSAADLQALHAALVEYPQR